jgi:[acyl-carrier-protein] S-malonyltransferase
VVANVDAEPKTDAAAAIEALIQQVSAPVRWEDVMRRLVAYGVTRFVEVGPGTVLCGLGKKTAREASFTNIDSPEHLARVQALFTT